MAERRGVITSFLFYFTYSRPGRYYMYACKEAMGYTDPNRRAGWLGGVWKGKKEKGNFFSISPAS